MVLTAFIVVFFHRVPTCAHGARGRLGRGEISIRLVLAQRHVVYSKLAATPTERPPLPNEGAEISLRVR